MKAIPIPAFSRHAAAAATAVIAVLAAPATVLAQGPGGPDGDGPPESSWSLGIGAISMQKPYAGTDRENKVLPVLQFENRYVNLFGPQIGIKLPGLELGERQELNFSLIGKYDGSGYKAKDSPRLAGMHDRKGGFWAGAEMEWKSDVADVKASWVADASGHSKGNRFSASVEKTWHIGNDMMITPRIEANWNDKKYIDYYYGVRADEARAGRPAYTGKAGASAEVGVRALYLFSQRHAAFVDVAVSSLAKSVKDSPLVDRSSENRILMGYTYRFR